VKRTLLKVYSRALRHWWLGTAAGAVITAVGAMTKYSAIVTFGVFLMAAAGIAFAFERAREAAKRERAEVNARVAELKAAHWPLTPRTTQPVEAIAPSSAEPKRGASEA
jgi:hypothetical protein